MEDTTYEDKTDHGCENVSVSIEDGILETQDENDSNFDVTTDSMMVSTDNEVQTDVAQNMEDNHDDIADVGGTSHDNENSDPPDHAHSVKIEENSKGENKSTPAPAAVGLQTSEVNGIVELFATALFEHSPYEVLTQDEYQSLGRFVTSSDHLARNIVKVVVDRHSSRSDANGKFEHTAHVRIFVKTIHLWESPRSYVWKHLGQDVWDRGNGTRITLRRIHQKT